MKIISLMNQKGGSGKTTMAFNITHCLKLRGYRVIGIDGDLEGGQYSFTNWAAQSEEPCIDVIKVPPNAIKQYIKNNRHHDYIVIDSPPTIDKSILPYLHVSNVVLIPMGASPLDFWASETFLEIVKHRQSELEGLPKTKEFPFPHARIVLSAVIRGTRLIKEVIDEIEECEIPLLRNKTTIYQTFRRCVLEGCSVYNYPEKNKEAIQQIDDIVDEILTEVIHETTK